MANETTITGAQLEQAIQTIVSALDWSEPPKSDTISPGQRRRVNDNALQMLIVCAREAMKQQEPATMPERWVSKDELADVSSNGEG